MASAKDTHPSDRVPAFQKWMYGFGAFANNLLGGAFGNMSIVLNLGLSMNPAVIGVIMFFSHLTDAFLDPIMGFISDHTPSRWGRRRPFIVVGALLSGLVFALIWQVPSGHSQRMYFWIFLIGSNLFYSVYTIYATPYIALGYEMTADYDERTRIQGTSNLIGQIPWLLLPWSFAFMESKHLFANSVQGARVLAVIIGLVAALAGLLPGIYCKEPYYAIARAAHAKKIKKAGGWHRAVFHQVIEFLKGFRITLQNRRFQKLAASTFLVFNGFMLISGLGSYVIIFYVMRGDQALGAQYVGWFGTALSVCTFGAIAIATGLATKLGKKPAFLICMSLAIAGYILKWFCYWPGKPWLLFIPTPLLAFGLGGLFTTVSAMIADVCDQDELEVGYRREGMFGAIYWWMVKLGTALSLAVAGGLLNLTGFRQELGALQSAQSLLLMRRFEIGLPILAYAIAIATMATYDLTPQKVLAIREELEKRRGKTEGHRSQKSK